ncbi:hypothetical protein EV356DRAFT_528366 [Viridothelium virens]|uniref:Secreted protein n=1 Tax=Viridothelium virens TaxID=1048519 RepID=A0A6A6HLS1_VIRVR|nr:hypothetical protein EV356DRAFT_528366 [Viridothelium virens]
MFITALLALPALAAALVLPPVPENSGTAPNASQVQIESLTYGGTGCPQGTVASVISDDRTTMTLIFDSYVASMGSGIAITENRKNCQLNINLQYPGGFQYSIFSADYRGFAELDAGVNGTQQSTYYFSGQTAQVSTQSNFIGPMDGDYLVHDQAQSISTIWSPCGANGALNINSQVRVAGSKSTLNGLMTTDSVDTKFTQIVYFNWQTCTH